MQTALVLGFVIAFLGFHVWALRAYLEFMTQHPDVEQQLVKHALKQSY